MILELDCGNSLIKWRITSDDNTQIIKRGVNQCIEHLLTEMDNERLIINFCRIVSVRSMQETEQILCSLKKRYPLVKQALSSAEYLGVKNGYSDYRRLGPDRWAAIVATYLQTKKASLILGFGTAIISDLINSQGQHLGGFIAPGLLLMRQQLLSNTGRIYYHEDLAKNMLAPVTHVGSSTEEAVNGGCHLMVQGFISQQLLLAQKYLGADFVIYITGGDAIHFSIQNAHYVPDLVFDGLALLCPLMAY